MYEPSVLFKCSLLGTPHSVRYIVGRAGGRKSSLALLGLGSWTVILARASEPNCRNEAKNCAASQGPENQNKVAPFLAQSEELMNDRCYLP